MWRQLALNCRWTSIRRMSRRGRSLPCTMLTLICLSIKNSFAFLTASFESLAKQKQMDKSVRRISTYFMSFFMMPYASRAKHFDFIFYSFSITIKWQIVFSVTRAMCLRHSSRLSLFVFSSIFLLLIFSIHFCHFDSFQICAPTDFAYRFLFSSNSRSYWHISV